MPFPAYQGALFYFEIVVGHAWRHEFRVLDRNTGEPMVWEPGWQAVCVIRDNESNELATLTDAGPPGGADGLITLPEGLIAMDLDSSFTTTLPVTTTYGRAQAKPFHWADLTLTDPDNGEPYLAARGKGVTYLPTTIGGGPMPQYPRPVIQGSLVGPRGPAGPAAPDALPAEEAVTTYVTDDDSPVAEAVDQRIDAKTGAVVADLDAETARATAAEAELADTIAPIVDVIPNGIIEGRALFQYGPSRGVAVTAQRLHYNRLRRRIQSGFFFNGSVGGHQAADTAALMYGTIATTSRQANGESEWSPSTGVSTFVNKAMQGGVFFIWPFGNDALHDGRPDRNSTTAKARASARNALRAIVALVRAETRIESVLNGVYTTTSGSPNITVGVGSPWYRGMLVQGAGIPANTYVGEMINGGLGGFKLSSSRTSQVDVNASASASGVTLTFSPVYTGTWATVTNTAFSSGNMVKTNADAATSTYVIHLAQARRVHWVTAGVDDAEYAGTKGAPFGGTGGAGYSVVVDANPAIVGTTSDEHRFGALDLCHGQKTIDLGVLTAGVHTITITSSGASKLLIDEGLLVESLTPPTVLVMKEVELPAAYYALLPTYGASYAKTQIYNGFIDDEVAYWPAGESVITHDITVDGYDKVLHISAADGAYAHFNDAGERLAANAILKRLNQLPARAGLVWT